MLKNLFFGMFQWIASAVLIINLALLNPFSEPVLFAPLPIAASPIERPSSVTPANPPSGAPKTQDANKEPAASQTQQRADQKSAQDLTSDPKQETNQAEPTAPYDMEAIKAFNRALYGS